jgi:dihydroneopterin aldolase
LPIAEVAKFFRRASATGVETRDNDFIHIEQLEVYVRVGVTDNERASPQRITLSISVWPNNKFDHLQDDISRAVNYSAICVAARKFVSGRTDKLIETLAGELASHLLQTFPIGKVQIELRKFVLPDAQYVAVTVTRTSSES